jgi:hypothetical protein
MAPAWKWEYGVRVTVVGHASARWRGAKSQAEANRLNDALSKQRAESIRIAVEQILKRELPNVKIEPSTSGSGQGPRGFELGSKGVGSGEPLRKGGPDENEAINRSVVVILELATPRTAQIPKSRPGRIYAFSTTWTLKVMEFQVLAIGPGGGFIKLILRNPFTGKEMSASANVAGGGINVDIIKNAFKKLDPNRALKVGKPIGDEVAFQTNRAMGFDDFDGQLIRVGKVELNLAIGIPKTKIGIGYGAKLAYLSFESLGLKAELLPFDASYGLRTSSWASGLVFAGKLKLEGQNPGDWLDMPVFDDGTYRSGDYYHDGMIVSFPTGLAKLSDLANQDRKRLTDFVTNWAKNIAVIAQSHDLSVK